MMKTTFVFFGGTGDLFSSKLFPALYFLKKEKRLTDFDVVGVGRRYETQTEYRKALKEKLKEKLGDDFNNDEADELLKDLYYVKGDYSDLESFKTFCELPLSKNIVFYLSTLPKLYDSVLNLIEEFFLKRCKPKKKKLVLEKPFGSDEKSAEELEDLISHTFKKSEIYRVDHYLGKEAVQNILLLRAENYLLEHLLSRKHVKEVRISMAESAGVKDRANFYDKTGVIKDIVQNHLFQVLAMFAIDIPKKADFDAGFFREVKRRKKDVLERLRIPEKKDIFLGQYKTYEEDIGHKSDTETFASFPIYINNNRWKGVPFKVSTGKRLKQKIFFVEIIFKEHNGKHNTLFLEFQPKEELKMRLYTKKLKEGFVPVPMDLKFNYSSDFGVTSPEAYENVLFDVVHENNNTFADPGFIKRSWNYIDRLIEKIDKEKIKVKKYDDHSISPAEEWV